MDRLKLALRYVLGVFFIVAGLYHFVSPGYYLKIMPPYLPWHLPLVYLSGFVEMFLGALLLVRKFSGVAAWLLIGLLLAVFPANIHMARHPELFPEIPRAALWLRLPLQGVLMLWAYWYTRPFESRGREAR